MKPLAYYRGRSLSILETFGIQNGHFEKKLRKPTHDTVGAMDQICYVSLGTTSHFSGNQVAKIEPLTKSIITSPKREIHEENLIIHDIYVGISKKTRVTRCVRITDKKKSCVLI